MSFCYTFFGIYYVSYYIGWYSLQIQLGLVLYFLFFLFSHILHFSLHNEYLRISSESYQKIGMGILILV